MKILAALGVLLLLQDAPEQKVRDLVSRLGADEIEAREDALKALVALGEPALPLLRRIQEEQTDAEVLSRLKSAVQQIERNAARSRVYRPAKPVTLKAKDKPLGDLLSEVWEQAGIQGTLDPGLADRKVSLEAEREPALKVLDRLCAAQGDLSVQMSDGKVRLAREKPLACPTAYADGFRARLRRAIVQNATNFDAPSATAILYVTFDAQPDLSPKGAGYSGMAKATTGKGAELAFKPVPQDRHSMITSAAGRGVVQVEDVAIPFDGDLRIETACFIKEAPPDLKRLDTLKVKASYRFATGVRTSTCPLKRESERAMFDGLSIMASAMGGTYLLLEPARGQTLRLEDQVDLDTLVIVTKDGKEEKCTRHHVRAGYYLFRCASDISSGTEIRVSAFDDVFEKEVEFDFRDVVLRE